MASDKPLPPWQCTVAWVLAVAVTWGTVTLAGCAITVALR